MHMIVRAAGDPARVADAARAAVAQLGTGRAMSAFVVLTDHVAAATSTLQIGDGPGRRAGDSAGLLSAGGLYTVIAYLVTSAAARPRSAARSAHRPRSFYGCTSGSAIASWPSPFQSVFFSPPRQHRYSAPFSTASPNAMSQASRSRPVSRRPSASCRRSSRYAARCA